MDEFQTAILNELRGIRAALEGGKPGNGAPSKPAKNIVKIVGQVTNPAVNNGWLNANVAGQKVSTKKPEFMQKLFELATTGKVAEVAVIVQEKPGTNGRTFTNRYVENINVANFERADYDDDLPPELR